MDEKQDKAPEDTVRLCPLGEEKLTPRQKDIFAAAVEACHHGDFVIARLKKKDGEYAVIYGIKQDKGLMPIGLLVEPEEFNGTLESLDGQPVEFLPSSVVTKQLLKEALAGALATAIVDGPKGGSGDLMERFGLKPEKKKEYLN